MTASLYEKIWNRHVVKRYDDGSDLLYIDRHLVQEVSSPQAFAGLTANGRSVRRTAAQIAVADHAVSTRRSGGLPRGDGLAAKQVARLEENCAAFGLAYIPMTDVRHGIVHVIGPELGFTLPGVTLVCGDSHTSTHGAFGAVAFGIGASECECVFATQTLRQRKQKTMRVVFEGTLPDGVTVKDMILSLIARIGTGGGVGHAIEYAGPAVEALSMEGRMTLCNMSIEAGGRAGMVAPDDTTFGYLKDKPYAPKDAMWDKAMAFWKGLPTDAGATFDHEVTLNGSDIAPMVTWGTSPEDALSIAGRVPDPASAADQTRRESMQRALDYMDLKPGTPVEQIPVDRVFIGSCTNSRIEDLRMAARIAKGRKAQVPTWVVAGSGLIKQQAEAEGLDKIFREAGFDWREPGCSMCIGVNGDTGTPGQRIASTSNRNFVGRQGRGVRTHLVSPAMAAAAAVTGRFTDVRKMLG
jgi:3-isopropylmalate/(R)-2-methylmalate dehydratase large subunit